MAALSQDQVINNIQEQIRARLASREREFDLTYEVDLGEKLDKFEGKPHIPVQANPLLNKTRFNFNLPNRLHIVVAGLGGTGGYVARDIGRLVKEKGRDYDTRITFIDPDIVEEKNLTRQNFIEDDIGWNKAATLAERYSTAFGLEIGCIEDYCNERVLNQIKQGLRPNETMLIIGCIDNNKGRREIHNFVARNSQGSSRVLGWIDSGNESTSGQVILGTVGNYCSHYLPFVTEYYPELLDPSMDPVQQEISCAERAQQDIQNMFVNINAATHILNFLNIIYSGKKSMIHGIEFSIRGANTPKYLETKYTKNSIPRSQAIWNKVVQIA